MADIMKKNYAFYIFLLLLSIPALLVVTQRLVPTTAHAAGTQIAFTVFLHGIGKGGDSANPSAEGNLDPHYRQRTVTATIFNGQNVQVATKAFVVTYNDTNGAFTGTISVNDLPAGAYTISVKADRYLSALLPGIQNIAAGQANQLAPVKLVAGDVNADDQINILDFNIIMNCFSDLMSAKECTDDQKVLSDLTDDQAVNQFDYNLFIRELGNRSGIFPTVATTPAASTSATRR